MWLALLTVSGMTTHTPDELACALRTGIESDISHGAVTPPIHVSSNFSFESFGVPRRFDYTRSGNPTRALFGDAVAALEGGAGATVVSTGMSAIALAVVALTEAGDHIVVPHDAYGGSWRLFDSLATRREIVVHTLDLTDTHTAVARIRDIEPKLVWLETPSNPLLRITDLEALIGVAKNVGATSVVDNTFLTPLGQRPFHFGADVVVHSATKYLNGHSDVVAGVAIGRTKELAEQLDWWGNVLGLTGSPFDSYLALRGLRTLELRFARHQESAQVVAEFLALHDAVKRVHFPGLATHPGHELARRQQLGFGGMLSFELRGGEAAVRRFLDGLEYFSLAESLGGVESLIAHPATMTHASMTPEARANAGVSDELLRLSIGIEPVEALLGDLEAGIARAAAVFESTS